MRSSRKRLTQNEQGKILVLVLVLMVVGGLLLTPLLGFMGTGLMAGRVFEKKASELYAADAGVEDAIWRIKYPDVAGLPPIVCGDKWEEEFPPYYIEMNGKSVEVVIEYLGLATYRVTSTASADGSSTRIEAYVNSISEYVSYSGLMDHIITINEMLTDKELAALENELRKVTLDCPAECLETCPDGCGGIYDATEIPDGCYGCGAVYNYGAYELWPQASVLIGWYSQHVDCDPGVSYSANYIDLAGFDKEYGPLCRDGELDIYNSSNTHATLNLTGTLYITGDTLIGTTKNDFTLNLNGYTIFVESSTSGSKNALSIGDRVTINGPGAIIAIGDIYFGPKGSVSGDEDEQGVFIMSVSGETTLQPSGDFFGSVAGNWYVQVKSGQEPILTYPPGGRGDIYDFPSLVEVSRECSIASWEIK